MALIICLARNNVPTASFTLSKPARNPAWQMRGIFQGHLAHTHARFLFFRLVPLSFLTRASCKRDLIPRILVFKARVFLYGRFQKSKGCAAVRALTSHQFGPGSNPGVDAIRGLSLLLVFSLASRDLSPGFPVFPSPQKPALPDSNSILNARTH